MAPIEFRQKTLDLLNSPQVLDPFLELSWLQINHQCLNRPISQRDLLPITRNNKDGQDLQDRRIGSPGGFEGEL